MRKLPELYPVATITILLFGPKPTSKVPTSSLVKVERKGVEVHDLSQSIRELERAQETVSDWLTMYRRWAEQDAIVEAVQP